jgi:hypothetical protein
MLPGSAKDLVIGGDNPVGIIDEVVGVLERLGSTHTVTLPLRLVPTK